MAKLPVFNITGLNLKLNPFEHQQGELIRSINMTNDFFGGKVKRQGYATFLNAPETANVTNIFQWTKNDGTTSFLYASMGSSIYYYNVGIGTATSWTKCTNGTIPAGARVEGAVLEDTLVIVDETGTTRHSTSGSVFTDTASAPIGVSVEEYQQRIHIAGTASDLFWSTTGTASDWVSDSSSINIPGAGKLNKIFKQNNRLIACKTSGAIFKYDGDNLYDLATDLGPAGAPSVAGKEDLRFWQNRDGYYMFDGAKPNLISNQVERQIYNNDNNGIPGGNFLTNAGVTFRYDYYCSAGTVTDDFTDETVADAIHKYNLQTNEWGNWKFADFPTAWATYKDNGGTQHMIFGDATGQVYKYGGSVYADNGSPISATMEGVLHFGSPENEKEFKWIWAFFNPGSSAKVQVAPAQTFSKSQKKWVTLGDAHNGVAELRFPEQSRGRLLFWKITENSVSPPFRFYGFTVDLNIVDRR